MCTLRTLCYLSEHKTSGQWAVWDLTVSMYPELKETRESEWTC